MPTLLFHQAAARKHLLPSPKELHNGFESLRPQRISRSVRPSPERAFASAPPSSNIRFSQRPRSHTYGRSRQLILRIRFAPLPTKAGRLLHLRKRRVLTGVQPPGPLPFTDWAFSLARAVELLTITVAKGMHHHDDRRVRLRSDRVSRRGSRPVSTLIDPGLDDAIWSGGMVPAAALCRMHPRSTAGNGSRTVSRMMRAPFAPTRFGTASRRRSRSQSPHLLKGRGTRRMSLRIG